MAEGSASNADNELYIANIGASPMGLVSQGHYCIPGLYTLGNYTNLCIYTTVNTCCAISYTPTLYSQ